MKKILLLFGGNSVEHQISCLSAKSIIENIDKKLFDLTSVGISNKNEWFIFNDNLSYLENNTWLEKVKDNKINNIVEFLKDFDVVLPILHGTNGEDGKLQGMLDLFNIKYVGCNHVASAIGMDKDLSKIIFNDAKIPQVPYITINYQNFKIKEIIKKLQFPLIVKPANCGSSIGISKANNKKELIKAIKIASEYDKKIIIEKFIKARELECAILQGKYLTVSEIGEIKSANEFYDYNAKYQNFNSKTLIPNDIPKNIQKKIKEYAKIAFKKLNAHSLARIDFFYDETNNKIYLNEINTIPGFTTISMYPKLIMNEGISYQDLITYLINNA